MKRFMALLTVMLSAVWLLGVQAAAIDVTEELIYMGESDGLYRYAFADGTGFSTTVMQGEQRVLMAAFQFDDTVQWFFTRNGELYDYVNETILQDPGQYEVVVTHAGGSEAAEFSFSIAQSSEEGTDALTSDLSGSLQFGKLISDAALIPSYDKDSGRYVYTFPNGAIFFSSVPRGAITADGVTLSFPQGTEAQLWINDQPVEYRSGQTMTAEGIYRFSLRQSARFSPAEDPNTYDTEFVVRVLYSADKELDRVPAPNGFSLIALTFNGQVQTVSDVAGCWLKRDGIYEMVYASQFSPGLLYQVEVTRDTTPPLLYFSETGLSGISSEPVLFSPSEESATVSVTCNGSTVKSDGTLTADGIYILTVSDGAGNYRTYHLRMKQSQPFALDARLILFAVFPAIALAVWLWRSRRLKVI